MIALGMAGACVFLLLCTIAVIVGEPEQKPRDPWCVQDHEREARNIRLASLQGPANKGIERTH